MRKQFDQAYYERFYKNPATRAATPQSAARQAAFIAAYLKHLEIPVASILDIGCGLGNVLRALGRAYPKAQCQGVEYSEYLCKKYGWTQGSLETYSDDPYDLVVCNDVIAYLDDRAAARAISNLAALTHSVLVLGALTREDISVADMQRTDAKQYLRPAAWYRRRLKPHFMNIGGGLYLKRPVQAYVWHLDCLDG